MMEVDYVYEYLFNFFFFFLYEEREREREREGKQVVVKLEYYLFFLQGERTRTVRQNKFFFWILFRVV